jgi:hypothetical protein
MDRGVKIMPVIVSPCLYEEARFKYPDWKIGPHELLLGSLQSINPPSRTLVEMSEEEQNGVLLAIARQLALWLEEDRKRKEEEMKPIVEHRKRMEELSRREHINRIEQLKRHIEEVSPPGATRHVFLEEICTMCGCSVKAIVNFSWFHCKRDL